MSLTTLKRLFYVHFAEEEAEAQAKYPFDRNYKITLAMKEFDRSVTEKENEKAAKEVKKNEKLPDTL